MQEGDRCFKKQTTQPDDEAMVERKTHEKLKEKAFEEFKQELLHEESKEIDELVSYTYHDNGQRS